MTASAPPARRLTFAGGLFGDLHRRVVGEPPALGDLDLSALSAELLARARATWAERVTTEFRSIQIMTRFLGEVVGAGDPLDVYAGALELVQDEIRHAELCAAVCAALGGRPLLPEPVALIDPPVFVAAPMAERALATAISMLGINETISVGYIDDLARRCTQPAIKRVLEETIADEAQHREFGWSYIAAALARFPRSSLEDWRHLVRQTLAPHEDLCDQVMSDVPADRRHLGAWDEPHLADLGLHSPQRLVLIYRHTLRETLEPRLRALGLVG